jgi:hypothetical protein
VIGNNALAEEMKQSALNVCMAQMQELQKQMRRTDSPRQAKMDLFRII